MSAAEEDEQNDVGCDNICGIDSSFHRNPLRYQEQHKAIGGG